MEEEIKIIEEMLNSKEPVCNYKLKHQEIEAISNLLTGYKQLEEENKQLEAIKDEAIRRYNFESIPKSLVKEKIEELNSRIEKYREYTEQGIETDVEWVDNVADRETVKALQDLLGKE